MPSRFARPLRSSAPRFRVEAKGKARRFCLRRVGGWCLYGLVPAPARAVRLDDVPGGVAAHAVNEALVGNRHPVGKAHLSKLQYNGVKVVVYGECAGTVQGQIDTPVSKRPTFANDALWTAYAERLNAFGEHLLSTYGIKLAYHHHMGAYVESPADVDKLMALTDPAKVFLLFDTGHAYFGGAVNPVALLEKHVKRVVHVHCKDVRTSVIAQARNDSWSFLNGVINGTFTVPGDGSIDYKATLTVLRKAGYEGWLVVEAEQDPAVAPSYEYAKKGFDTLRGLVDSLA